MGEYWGSVCFTQNFCADPKESYWSLVAVRLFGSQGFTQQRRKWPFFLEMVFVFSSGVGAWGDVSSWSAEVPLGAITGIGSS